MSTLSIAVSRSASLTLECTLTFTHSLIHLLHLPKEHAEGAKSEECREAFDIDGNQGNSDNVEK